MATGLEVFNIIEPWTEDTNDVCTYLYSRNIKFDMRGSDALEFKIDLAGYIKVDTFIIYTVKLEPEDASAIALTFPNVRVKRRGPPEKVSTLAKRVFWKATT